LHNRTQDGPIPLSARKITDYKVIHTSLIIFKEMIKNIQSDGLLLGFSVGRKLDILAIIFFFAKQIVFS
jgi:hypothetical protein